MSWILFKLVTRWGPREDFNIAQLSNKKFAAKVAFVGEDGVTVKFLKRTVKGGGFVVNEIDTCFIDYEDKEVTVLPKRFCSEGTRSASFLLKFLNSHVTYLP